MIFFNVNKNHGTHRSQLRISAFHGKTQSLSTGSPSVKVASCIELLHRAGRVITPANSAHRIVLIAIERGTLQPLVFDNQAHLNHRAMAAILGVILKLPPV